MATRGHLGRMSFTAAVSQWGEEALVKVDKVRRLSIMEVFKLVIMATPVDTGLLRGNWQCSINSPILMTTDRTDKAGAAVIAEALANLGSMADVVYMVNSLPYVEQIEYEGYSAQAPEGMVRKAVLRWPEIVEKKAAAVQ